MASPSFINLPERLREQIEQFERLRWQLLCELRVACPGIIQSFDPTTQTATVQLAITENILFNSVPKQMQIPQLVNVPVAMPRAGGYTITLPIQAGDECLVIFADMCYDAWWQSSGVQNQADRRRHDLSDGIALVGIWSQPKKLSSYNATALEIRNDAGDTVITVSPGTITLTALTINLNAANAVNISGITTIEGKNFLNHQHTGVQNGTGDTGGVL